MPSPLRTCNSALALSLLLGLLTGGAAAQRRVPDVPYVPTPMEVVDQMLALAAPDSGDVVYDLGSGDGRIVIAAAQRYGARGVGYDLDAELVRLAEENARAAGVADRVRFVRGDLFEADLRPASVVTLYLLSTVNLKLRPILLEQLRPGTRVVSHAFSMGEWEPDSIVVVNRSGEFGPRVYYWVIPARAGGAWTVQPDGGEPFTLRIEQEFQQIRGTARVRDRIYPLEGTRLTGDAIAFSFREAAGEGSRMRRFTGRITAGGMVGTVTEEGEDAPRAWRARRLAR